MSLQNLAFGLVAVILAIVLTVAAPLGFIFALNVLGVASAQYGVVEWFAAAFVLGILLN